MIKTNENWTKQLDLENTWLFDDEQEVVDNFNWDDVTLLINKESDDMPF